MIDLNDTQRMLALDPQRLIQQIDDLPNQLEAAERLGKILPLPLEDGVQSILIAGIGASAVSADLLTAYLSSLCPLPILVHRDFGLPAWAKDSKTLVILCSVSGNSEETLSVYAKAKQNGCRILVLSTGGNLSKTAMKDEVPVWTYPHTGQPRSAIGWTFGLLLTLFARLDWIPPQQEALRSAVTAMRSQQPHLKLETPVSENPAKRMSGQWMGRSVSVFGSGVLAPVALRWKSQINKLAKASAVAETLPDADTNTLAGLFQPEAALRYTFSVFLRSPSDHPSNRQRSDWTRQGFMMEGLNTDFFDAPGDSSLAQMWTALHFGDYAAFYLAMGYGIDPTPAPSLDDLKAALE